VDHESLGRIAAKARTSSGRYPPFSEFADFLAEEARIACDPNTSLVAYQCVPEVDARMQKRKFGANVFLAGTQANDKLCKFCQRKGHTLHECWAFSSKNGEEKRTFIQESRLCFGCLEKGHIAKQCPKRSVCQHCKQRHPTCLHQKRDERPSMLPESAQDPNPEEPRQMEGNYNEACCRGVLNTEAGTQHSSSMIVPVWLSSEADPQREHLTYAMLDTMSDTTFVLTDTLEMLYRSREDIFRDSQPINLRLTTMTERDKRISSRRLDTLMVRGYNSQERIPLRNVFSREFIPVERSHIPTTETAKKWPHLRDIAHLVQPLMDCEVGLLIGYDCPRALAPINCVIGRDSEPFGVETDLGWSIVGKAELREDSGDAIGLTYRVVTCEVPPNLQPKINRRESFNPIIPTKVSFTFLSTTHEENLRPVDVANLLEADFIEREREKTLSQEDLRFMRMVEEGVHQQEDGYFALPLPFKEKRPKLPNNRRSADLRLMHLKRRFMRDNKHCQAYKTFMEDIIKRGEAEEVPISNDQENTVWYIPHHGVYNPNKPGKIRVVFDCAAKFQGTSLNDHLLQGPDQLNTLVGVLCRFRLECTAIICDIERMYHRFRVHQDDRDYLRFLWWPGGDLNAKPKEYRMKVHIFGAVSSPGCAIFALKFIARKYACLGLEASRFIANDFYMDDGLISVADTASAVKLIHSARAICARGNLRLHKFASNDRKVMEAIPNLERAKDLVDLDLSLESLPVERALGMKWCIKMDQFHFQVAERNQPTTRRGILSTIASVFDPLGMIAPFILKGKQILQEVCKMGCDWDDPLPEEIVTRWEKWKSQLPRLAALKIPRCYKPKDFGEAREMQLHHFSDASTMGYGQCTYLKQISRKGQMHCSLIMGKSRVVPIRPITIPRLELQAAVTSQNMSNLEEGDIVIIKENDIHRGQWRLARIANTTKASDGYVRWETEIRIKRESA